MKKISYLLCSIILFSFFLVSCKKEAEPIARYTLNKTAVIPDETIDFTNTSENASSYLWDFGDGNTSTEENPKHAYSSSGIFTVTLTVTGKGGKDSFKQTVEVSMTITGTWITTFHFNRLSYEGIFEITQHSNNLVSGTFFINDGSGYKTDILSSSIIDGVDVTLEWMSVGTSSSYRYTFDGMVKNNFTRMSGGFYIYSISGYVLGSWSAVKSSAKSVVLDTVYNEDSFINQNLVQAPLK